MDLQLKIYITHPRVGKFLGIGMFWLLEGIEKHGSIKKAAEEMGLSYVKAHSMLNNLEEALGCRVVHRKQGGEKREGAQLNELGRQVVSRYDEFQKKVKAAGEEHFINFKHEILGLIEKSGDD